MDAVRPRKGEAFTPAPMPGSLWASIARPAPATVAASGDADVDIVIIGAGYLGLSAAIHLAGAGRRVAVLEASEIGWGASGRNGGQVIPGLKIDPDEVEAALGPARGVRLVKWAGEAPALVFDMIAKHRIECDGVRNGWIQPAYSKAALRIVESRCRQWKERGARVRLLDPGELGHMLGTDRYIGAWLDERGGSINPLGYCRGLAAAAIAAGASIFTSTPVSDIVPHGGAWKVVSPSATFVCDKVVVATAAYGTLLPALRRSIIPVRIGEVATEPLSEELAGRILPGRQVASDWRRLLTSFRVTPDGRLMMGGSTATAAPEHDGIRRSLHRAAEHLFGHLGRFRWSFFWSGVFAVTQDKLPHLHEPGPGLLAAVGCNGRGIAVSTAIGKMIAEYLLGRDAGDLELPITGIVPRRFHAMYRPGMGVAVGWKGVLDRVDRLLT